MRKLNGKRLLSIVLGLILTVSMAAFFVSCKGPVMQLPEECTVTFETEGGTAVDPIVVKGGEMAEKPENPTKSGHVFKGWYLDLNNTEAGAFMFDETPITGDITLHALWQIRQFVITYKHPSGEEMEGLGGVANWGTLLTKPDETALAKDGYLVKWYTDQGGIWDFETSKVTANTTLTYQYVTTKDTYTGKEIADHFYPSFNRGDLSPENSQEHYVEGATGTYYTYKGTQLQQAVLNVELKTLEYTSVTVKMRSVGFSVNSETGEYTFDATAGGTFSQVRGYILTDVGGHLSFNDFGASGYDPVNYYIQSTGTNKQLYSQKDLGDGWLEMTFDVAALKYWQDSEILYGFGIGYVSSTKAVEIESVVFNKVDKTQSFTVQFTDRIGNTLAESQSVVWNTAATKPAKIEDANGYVYTGEWLDASGEVYDFSKGVRSNVTLTPQYTITNKYSWTGEEIAKDLYAVLNEDKTLPAIEYALNGNSGYTFNNGAGNSCKQIGTDALELAIGSYKYLTFKARVIDNKNNYTEAGAITRIRIYLATDLGGSAFDKDLEGAENFYYDFQAPSASEVTAPIDMSAKFEGGWYVITIDMTALPYYANGTTLKGFSLGVVCGDANGIELAEVYFSEALEGTDVVNTVTFVDEEGNAITGIDAQSVPYGKAAAMPDSSLVPAKVDHAFDRWVDAEGNDFVFGTAVTASVVLHPAYVESWEGSNYTLKGQQIVDNFKAGQERYGNSLTVQKDLSLDTDNNAFYAYNFNKPNMTLTILNTAIRVHEGSKLVVTFKSNQYPTYTPNRINLALSFKGQDPATQIKNSGNGLKSYFQYKDIKHGTTSGTGAEGSISFVVAEDGTVTAMFDLYAMQQLYVANGGAIGEGVDISYINAFSFMLCETDTANKPQNSNSTLTFYGFEFQDVQMAAVAPDEEEEGGEEEVKTTTKTLKGQQIVDAFTASFERYGNTLENQKALSLDDAGNAYFAYNFGKPNKSITMLNANLGVVEGSKIVIKFKSSANAEKYHITQAKIGFAFKGEDPATTIHNKGANAKYYNVSGLLSTTTEATNNSGAIAYSIDSEGVVTVTYDLYILQQASTSKITAGADVNVIDAFSILLVESNDDAKTNTANNSTITYYSIEFQNVVL
ncbi:MAG: InlB B-repeat-containing protein [Clostridia bacterium]|nr:InlB B-repeat-containing protein [Clostridia bacterium]